MEINIKEKFSEIKSKVRKFTEKNQKAVRYGSIGISVLGVLLILYPFIPAILHLLNPPDETVSPYAVEDPGILGIEREETDKIPDENRLVIPSIGVDAEILEGESLNVLNRSEGVWHEPNTGDPVNGGNLVVSGHRFQFLPPNMVTLYNLDKTETGDKLIVYWNKKEYDYEVKDVFVVEPTQIEIRDSTPGKAEVTVYTCTPLWNNTHRLVVKAEPIVTEDASQAAD